MAHVKSPITVIDVKLTTSKKVDLITTNVKKWTQEKPESLRTN